MAALHRVCLDNTLFLPSFPISDMSDLEIEKAAMGPRRWIEYSIEFEKLHLDFPGAIMWPRSTRIINDSFATKVSSKFRFFLVPGGRYLVTCSPGDISVLDMGYTSGSSADCKLIASVGFESNYGRCGYNNFQVQATPDGIGLTIYLGNE